MKIDKKKKDGIPSYLRRQIANCTNCTLSTVRRKHCSPVMGRGVMPADILFIGESPNLSEEMIGSVFVGKPGKLFDKMINDAKILLKKEARKDIHTPSYYITNIVCCRPTNERGGQNREPLPVEVLACTKNLMAIYKSVEPSAVIFIGKVAEKYYKKEFRDAERIFHPAYLLRGGGPSHPYYLQTVRTLMEVFDKTFSERGIE